MSTSACHNFWSSGRLLREHQGKDDAIIAKIHFYRVFFFTLSEMCSGHSLSDLWVPSVARIELEPQLGTALPGNMTGLGARGNLASSWNVQILSAAISHKAAICHKTATGRRARWSLAMVGSPSFRLWQVQVLRFKALKVWYFFSINGTEAMSSVTCCSWCSFCFSEIEMSSKPNSSTQLCYCYSSELANTNC